MNAPLEGQLKRLRKRVRLLLAERYGLFGGAAGALVAALLVVLSYRYDALLIYWLWAGIVLFGAAAGVAWGLLRPLDDLTVALAADKRTGLKERLSTAVALRGDHEEMTEALVNDSCSKIAAIDSADVFRHRFGLPHIVCGAALIALLAVVFIPMMPELQSKTHRQEVAVMKTEGKKLVRIAKQLKDTDDKHEQIRKLAGRLEKLGKKMTTGRISKKQAMLKAQRLAKDVKREQDRLAKENSSLKSMEQARADMRKASENLAKSMAERLAKQRNIPPAEALRKLPSDKQLAALAHKDGPLSPAEQKQLEQALSKYADPNNKSGIPPELGEALAKLAANKDYQKAMELMQKLAQKMESGQMSSADKEALKKQMEALAKALKGTDLDKFAKMMLENAEKLSKMSPQELAKLAQQMQKMQQMANALKKAGAG